MCDTLAPQHSKPQLRQQPSGSQDCLQASLLTFCAPTTDAQWFGCKQQPLAELADSSATSACANQLERVQLQSGEQIMGTDCTDRSYANTVEFLLLLRSCHQKTNVSACCCPELRCYLLCVEIGVDFQNERPWAAQFGVAGFGTVALMEGFVKSVLFLQLVADSFVCPSCLRTAATHLRKNRPTDSASTPVSVVLIQIAVVCLLMTNVLDWFHLDSMVVGSMVVGSMVVEIAL